MVLSTSKSKTGLFLQSKLSAHTLQDELKISESKAILLNSCTSELLKSKPEDVREALKILNYINKLTSTGVKKEPPKKTKKKNEGPHKVDTKKENALGTKKKSQSISFSERHEIRKNESGLHRPKRSSSTLQVGKDASKNNESKKPISDLDLHQVNITYPSLRDEKNLSVKTESHNSTGFNHKVRTGLPLAKQSVADKSQSSDSFKLQHQRKPLSKSVSLETRKVNKPYQSTAKVYNKQPQLETSQETVFNNTDYSGRLPWHSQLVESLQQFSNKGNTDSFPKNLSLESKPLEFEFPKSDHHEKFCVCPSQERTDELIKNLGCAVKNSKPLTKNPSNGEKFKRSSWQNYFTNKKAGALCQCLHFHDGGTIKRICIHNCTNTKNSNPPKFTYSYPFSSKIDLVDCNKVLKKLPSKDKSIESSEQITHSDTSKTCEHEKTQKTFPEEKPKPPLEEIQKKKSPSEIKETVPIKTQNTHKKIEKAVKTKKKKQEINTGENENKILLWSNENQIQILGEQKRRSFVTNKIPEKIKKSGTDTKAKHNNFHREEKEKEKIPFLLPKAQKEKDESKLKVLEEIKALESLFAKLNVVERSLKRRSESFSQKPLVKLSDKQDWHPSKVPLGDDKKNLFNTSKLSVIAENDVADKYQEKRRKLKSAIIQHVKNWLTLDFTDKKTKAILNKDPCRLKKFKKQDPEYFCEAFRQKILG